MNTGWLKLYRKLLDSPLYRSLNSKWRDVMVVVLLSVNHEEKEWEWQGEIYKCKPGQTITSLDSILGKCARDVTMQNVRTAIKKLEKWDFLTNKSTKTGRLITVVKWDKYQPRDPLANKDANKELTKSQQRANKELTPNKNDIKNDIRMIEKESPPPRKSEKKYKPETKTQAQQFLTDFNRIRGTGYKSTASFLANFEFWLTVYSLDEMVKAVERAKDNDWFDDTLNPDLLFRRRNKNGECDYIGQLLNLKPRGSGVIKI